MRPESARDAEAAKALAARFGVECRVVRLQVVPRSEGEARDARHTALAAIGRPVVALGHTADDQVETVLLRLARGTGISGLRGMRERETGPAGALVVRPLLGLSRDCVEGYLARHGIEAIEDPTNADPAFADRNRIRHRVVPELRELNPRLAEAVGRLAELARDDDAALEEWARRDLAAMRDFEGESGLRLREFLALPVAIQRRVVRLLAPGMEFPHVEAVMALAAGRRPGHTHLPGGLIVSIAAGRLAIGEAPPTGGAKCRICLTQGGLVPSMNREIGNYRGPRGGPSIEDPGSAPRI
jgi:tRNA(Ile)-lysidine synthetase-like protein